jgi:hypothetical protein
MKRNQPSQNLLVQQLICKRYEEATTLLNNAYPEIAPIIERGALGPTSFGLAPYKYSLLPIKVIHELRERRMIVRKLDALSKIHPRKNQLIVRFSSNLDFKRSSKRGHDAALHRIKAI